MLRICIVGTGRVGHHVTEALKHNSEVKQINSRSLQGIPHDYDVYLLCVSDSAIREVGKAISEKINPDSIIAHTSGCTSISELGGLSLHYGVFYPLQTFSKEVLPDYRKIPVLIEGSDPATVSVLSEVAHLFSENVQDADSEKRCKLHLASVISNNFANHLWALADEYLTKNGMEFSILYPLLEETLRKAMTNRPATVQTGPAARGDMKTINRHMELLRDDERMVDIYQILSRSIMQGL